MKISAAYPSPYIRAADLDGTPRTLTIRTCVMEELGQGNDREKKPVLHFQDRQKALVLNRTNSNVIAEAYGDETGGWEGRPVEVYPTQVQFKGKLVDGIRVRIQPEAKPEKEPDAAPMADVFDDEIPDF